MVGAAGAFPMPAPPHAGGAVDGLVAGGGVDTGAASLPGVPGAAGDAATGVPASLLPLCGGVAAAASGGVPAFQPAPEDGTRATLGSFPECSRFKLGRFTGFGAAGAFLTGALPLPAAKTMPGRPAGRVAGL